jgi:hypothetical protein
MGLFYYTPYIVKWLNFTLEQAMNAKKGSRDIALHFFKFRAWWKWVVKAAIPPGKRLSTHFTEGSVGSRSGVEWCGMVWNTSTSPRIHPRTAQPVANRYTDCAILVHLHSVCILVCNITPNTELCPSYLRPDAVVFWQNVVTKISILYIRRNAWP